MLGQNVRFRSSDVEAWLSKQYEDQLFQNETPLQAPTTPKHRGRPTKAEEVRRRRVL